MTNGIIPSIEREIGKRRPGDGAPLIKANLADVVASFDDDNEDAAFGGEVAGDLDEEATVVVVIEGGAEAGGCEIPLAVELVAAVHPIVVVFVIAIAVVLVLAISIVLIHAIAVVIVHAIAAVPVLTIVVVTVHTSVAAVVHAIVIIPVLTIAVVLVLAIGVVPVNAIVVVPIVLVLAIPIILLFIALVVVEVMVVLILATVIAVVVLVVVVILIPVVVTRVFVPIAIAVVVAGPSARELAVAIAFTLGARSRAIVLAPLPLGDTGKDGFGTSHEGCVKAFALPELRIREGDLGFLSWDKAWREVESGMRVVAFGEEVLIFGGAGIEVDEFREKGGNVVRGQRCLDQNMD